MILISYLMLEILFSVQMAILILVPHPLIIALQLLEI